MPRVSSALEHVSASDVSAKPVWPVARAGLEAWRSKAPAPIAAWLAANKFEARAGEVLAIPDGIGGFAGAVLGLGKGDDLFAAGALATKLPAGAWTLAGDDVAASDLSRMAQAFLLGAYKFNRYRKKDETPGATLVLPRGHDPAELMRVTDAVYLVRDLVNTPANDMGPEALEQAARDMAERAGASLSVTTGPDLLKRNFPLVYHVGAGSPRAPRLVDISWLKGSAKAPKITLVGKGVCFDTGGLNLKPDSGMALMKKDMAGAAHALALGELLIGAGLDIRLRVLLPIVENSISGSAMRPSDVLPSRKGLTVEIGNTDAEGRLVLADALALADEETPDLLIDFATLTGAARTALGPEIVPFYTDDEALAQELARYGSAEADPVWRMPLWRGYADWLDSRIADTNNVSEGAFAGSVTAALFLQKFVEKAKAWVHFDLYGWSPKARPGHPQGGEAQTIRALYVLLKERYGRRA